MLGDLEHFVGERHLRNVGKIFRLVSDFVRVTQRDCQKPNAHRLEDDRALSVGENNPTHAYQTFLGHGIPYDREGFLSDLIAGGNVIRSVVITRIDLLPDRLPSRRFHSSHQYRPKLTFLLRPALMAKVERPLSGWADHVLVVKVDNWSVS